MIENTLKIFFQLLEYVLMFYRSFTYRMTESVLAFLQNDGVDKVTLMSSQYRYAKNDFISQLSFKFSIKKTREHQKVII